MLDLSMCKALVFASKPNGEYARAIKEIRNKLISRNFDNNLKIINVISNTKNEETSTLSLNLAYAYAELKKKVLLIDMNLNEPTLDQKLNIVNSSGLTDMLVNRLIPSSVFINVNNNLDFLPVGTKNSFVKELVESVTFGKLLEALKTKYDVILLDSSLIDGLVLSKKVDGSLLCVDSGTSEKELLAYKERLVDTKVLGVVMMEKLVTTDVEVKRKDRHKKVK